MNLLFDKESSFRTKRDISNNENIVNSDAKQKTSPSLAKFNSLLVVLLLKIKERKKKINFERNESTNRSFVVCNNSE